ncbi:MAG: nitrilase-related carbon-nitrogen hydrolase, partial [Hyphomicrobiaceae bacterium]
MRIAIYQGDGAGLTGEGRLERLKGAAGEARADLLVTPELFMSGYAVGDAIPRLAEPADGPMAAAVARIARASGTAIVYGFPERAGGVIYNTAQAIGADGRVLARHRKLAIPPGRERAHFTSGGGLTQFDLAGLRLGLVICYDIEFPETVRAHARAGAHAVIAPTALGAEWDVVAERLVPARAFENGVFVAYANHAGREGDMHYLGGSVIAGPDGRDRARAGAGGCVIAAVMDRESVARAQA